MTTSDCTKQVGPKLYSCAKQHMWKGICCAKQHTQSKSSCAYAVRRNMKHELSAYVVQSAHVSITATAYAVHIMLCGPRSRVQQPYCTHTSNATNLDLSYSSAGVWLPKLSEQDQLGRAHGACIELQVWPLRQAWPSTPPLTPCLKHVQRLRVCKNCLSCPLLPTCVGCNITEHCLTWCSFLQSGRQQACGSA